MAEFDYPRGMQQLELSIPAVMKKDREQLASCANEANVLSANKQEIHGMRFAYLKIRFVFGMIFFACALLALQGCALMPNSGPSKRQVLQSDKPDDATGVPVIKVDEEIARKLGETKKTVAFSKVFGKSSIPPYTIGPGDVLEISIWETPPAILFKSLALDTALGAMASGSEEIPPQRVMEDGTISIPFAGRVKVAGRSPAKIEADIASRLSGKANNPQVMLRVVDNPASQVSVIGDVNKSCNIPLTPKGERILDALAAAEGVSHPITKTSLQLSRKGVNARMPLDKIIDDPEQNLQLAPGDVVAALFQPWTYSVLGATGRNQEVPFEAAGISLAQALSRTGGLNDARADPGGVFIFRFEDAALVQAPTLRQPSDGKLPVVYQIDFNEPSSFFAIQNFPMQDKDVLYVANMPSAELEKFLRMVGMVLTPTLNLGRYQLQVND